MTSSVKSLVLVCMVILLAACSTTSSYSTHPSGDPVIAREARALGLSYLDAIEGAADCAAIGPRLDAAFADQSARIDLLANARVRFGEGPTKEEQSRLLKAAEKVKGCAGKIQAPAAAQAVAPLGKLVRPIAAQKTATNCYENCCVEGWETWAEVTFWTLACAGGSNQACCMAVTIASYDACINLYCPTNDCCSDVPVSVPPGP